MPPAKRRHGGELSAQKTNLYEILQVPKTASQREIVQAYHQRALKLHPDKQGGDKDMFQKVAQAYEILANPTTRDSYHMSLLYHRSNDGLVINAKADLIPNMRAVHPLTSFPDEMVQLLLAVPLQGWQRLLREFRVDQLDGLLKALNRLTKSGRKPTRKEQGANAVGGLKDNLMHLSYRSSQGIFEASLILHGFDICTPTTKLEPVAAFYHSAIVELKEQVIKCSQANQDFEAAMKEALHKLASLGFACPFIYRFVRSVGGKLIQGPRVADLGLALAMRREAQEVQDSRPSPSTIKRLKDQWRRDAQASSEANQTLRQTKAAALNGYIMALQESLRVVAGPLVRVRRDGKQPPDINLKIPFLAKLAANLQLETADLELQLASPAGQKALLSFFEQNQSTRTSALPLECPCSTFGSSVLGFVGLVDLARLGATQKQCRQDVHTSLDARCTDGLELTSRDFSDDAMYQISQVIGFLHQRCLAEVRAISFSEELPATLMSQGLLWATLSAMSNLKVVFLHRVHALCPPADAARKFAVQVGL